MKSHLEWYLGQTRMFPILDVDEERRLAREWRDTKDPEAARQLLGSHLRLVVKIARGYAGYGMPLADLVAEGNVGVIQALARFEPERGFRFATYAMWWIHAAVKEYVLHNRSAVKMGTTAEQKKLFFNLRRLKSQLGELGEGDLASDTVTTIAQELEVGEGEVIKMNRRLAGMDQSLSAPMRADGEAEWQDMLVADGPDQESLAVDANELEWRRDLLAKGLEKLNDREQHILKKRRLSEEAMTLADLGHSVAPSAPPSEEPRTTIPLSDVAAPRGATGDDDGTGHRRGGRTPPPAGGCARPLATAKLSLWPPGKRQEVSCRQARILIWAAYAAAMQR